MEKNIINFDEIWNATLNKDFVLYNISPIYKNVKKYMNKDHERLLMMKNDLSEYNENDNFINLDDIWKWLGFSQKAAAKRLIEKEFVNFVDYHIVDSIETINKGRGGHNKETILLTIKAFYLLCLKGDTQMSKNIQNYSCNLEKLLINSFNNNLKINDTLDINQPKINENNLKNDKIHKEFTISLNNSIFRNDIHICIENQTIGFIEKSFNGVINVKRQHIFGKYKVDLYFMDYNLVVECDEFNHKDRNPSEEKIREDFILSLGNSIIRYNPNDKKFDLSNVLKEIYRILFSKEKQDFKVILV